jgi:hypothetical protein
VVERFARPKRGGYWSRIIVRAEKGHPMMSKSYEYKFVRLGEGWVGVRKVARDTYQEVVEQHARDGWRLVQIFAPGIGPYGAAKFYELILERER